MLHTGTGTSTSTSTSTVLVLVHTFDEKEPGLGVLESGGVVKLRNSLTYHSSHSHRLTGEKSFETKTAESELKGHQR
jgi:hypothetical protein